MCIKITKTDNGVYFVNGKPVYVDSDGRPVSKTFELTPSEERATLEYIKSEGMIQTEDRE